jgi:hypothetical protein
VGTEANRRPQKEWSKSWQYVPCGQSQEGGNRTYISVWIKYRRIQDFQATVEKVLKCLSEDKKDVRKGDWTNKEVSPLTYFPASSIPIVHSLLVMRKSAWLESNPAHRGGSNAPFALEMIFTLTTTRRLRSFLNHWSTNVCVAHRSTS